MKWKLDLTTAAIKDAFTEELEASGGTISDAYDDNTRLFLRAILPRTGELGLRDHAKAGVALRAVPDQIAVHPYVFRVVCTNGAIMAHALQTHRIEIPDWAGPETVLTSVRDGVRQCCREEAFADAAAQIRAARQSEADFALAMMAFVSRLRAEHASGLVERILDRFARHEEPNRFGLMNAITATARTVRDPEVKWRLEELGGSVPAFQCPKSGPRPWKPRPAARADLCATAS